MASGVWGHRRGGLVKYGGIEGVEVLAMWIVSFVTEFGMCSGGQDSRID